MERSCGRGKGRNLQQSSARQNQGRRRDHCASRSTVNITQAPTPPTSTIIERTPHATNEERALHMHDPLSRGAHGVASRDNAWEEWGTRASRTRKHSKTGFER